MVNKIKHIEKFLNRDLYFVVYEVKKQLHTLLGSKERCESVIGGFGNLTISIVKEEK